MKKLKLFLFLLMVAAIKNTFAQESKHLKLSTPYPEAGKNITLTYNPAGTPIEGKPTVLAKIYYADNKKYPVDEIPLKAIGKLWTGDFIIADSAKAFVVKFTGSDSTDNNHGNGYMYQVYKHKKPVMGAYAASGYAYISGRNFGLKPNVDLAIKYYQNEFALYPSSAKKNQVYLYMLMGRKNDPAIKANINKKIDSLEQTGDEDDLEAAIDLLNGTYKTKRADSLSKIMKTKFPNGQWARYKLQDAFMIARDLPKKDSIYNLLSKATKSKDGMEFFNMQMAAAHLQNADFAGYNKYKSLMTDTSNLDAILNEAAYGWAQFGLHNADAQKISKESIDILKAKIDHPVSMYFRTASEVKQANERLLDDYYDTYSLTLYNEGKYAEALKIQAPVWDRNKLNKAINEHYALMLVATGDYTNANNIIEATIKAGNGSAALSDALKKCYIHQKGSENGFVPYLAALDSIGKTNSPEYQADNLIDKPAPAFVLKDLNGKTVSLAGLKGKTVIIDFWATWCGPCKASMPGMQMAANKYKDNPDIKFLFIDTWESGDNYIEEVKDFIKENNYSFTVLYDEKNDNGRQEKIISQYKVNGIPTKFVIDKNGILRIKHVGYDGSDLQVLAGVTEMIDKVK